MFLNPHLEERCICTLSSSCFQEVVNDAFARLWEQSVRFLKHMLCFKRADPGDGVDPPFRTALENDDALPTGSEVQRFLASITWRQGFNAVVEAE